MGDENKIPGLEMQMSAGQPTHVKIFSQLVPFEGRDFSAFSEALKLTFILLWNSNFVTKAIEFWR